MNSTDKRKIIFSIIYAVALIAVFVSACCLLHTVKADGVYTDRYDVALYIYRFGNLPNNFLTKGEYGRLDFEDKALYNIGGNEFFNREGKIDNPYNLKMVECDIYSKGFSGLNRGAERMVFFADGSKVYYTADHYETFALITVARINCVSYVLFAVFGAMCVFAVILIIIYSYKSGRLNRKGDFVMEKIKNKRVGTMALLNALAIEFLVGAILTLCFVANKAVSYALFGCLGVIAIAGLTVLCVKGKKDSRLFVDYGLSLAVLIIAVFVIALSPIVLLLWIVESITESIHANRAKKALDSIEE